MGVKTNRSYYYLYKTIGAYGGTFLNEMLKLTSYAKGDLGDTIINFKIADSLYYQAKRKSMELFNLESYLFIEFDPRGVKDENRYVSPVISKTLFLSFLKFCRKSKYYVDDYWTSDGHMIVLKVHKKYEESYKHFLRSEYSKMYSEEQLKEMGIKIKSGRLINLTAAVLMKDKEHGLSYLKSQIYERFGTEICPDEPNEYDLPWVPDEEILNYESNSN